MKYIPSLCLAFLLVVSGSAFALDRETAAAYAKSAETSAKDGKTDSAKELCYSALALDENCPTALYELGKLFERDGNKVAAADFFTRACREFAKDESIKDFALKHADAEARIKRLNEFAPRFSAIMADYTQELNTITKRSPDSLTLEEACDRADGLDLRNILPSDKAPKFERPSAPAKTPASARSSDDMRDGSRGMRSAKREVVTNVPPDVERELKKAGWETITGIWKKKGDGVYEVTDGKLEAEKMIGSIQVIVDKGGSGNVKVNVRNGFNQYSSYSSSSSSSTYSYSSGFGFLVFPGEAKMFCPYSFGMSSTASSMHPRMERVFPMTGPRTIYRISIEENRLEYFVNNKKEKTAPNRVPKEGPFCIEINGTMTIEDPRSLGQ